MTRDTLELRIDRRPDTRDKAMALALELYWYCPDIIDQGVKDQSTLAAYLMETEWWFFWWD